MKIPIKLTEAQWRLVIEATSEWGRLTVGESEYSDGTTFKPMELRGKKMEKLADEIYRQLVKSKSVK